MNRKTIAYIAFFFIIVIVILSTSALGYWIFIAALAYGATGLMISIYNSFKRYRKSNKVSRRECVIKIIARFMGLFFITGTIIFAGVFGFIEKINSEVIFSNAEIVVRSFMSSLNMFMLDVDSNILDALSGYTFTKFIIVLQSILSFGCTVILFISLVLSRAVAYYKLHRNIKISPTKNQLNIFFGINDNSTFLAKNIKENNNDSICVFVDYANFAEDDYSSWSNIVSFLTHRRKTFEYADEADALVAIASKQLSDINENNLKGEDIDVFSLVEIDKIRDLIQSIDKLAFTSGANGENAPQLRIFFLSDNEDNNIRSLINLIKDKTICEVMTKQSPDFTIYCHARRGGPASIIADWGLRRKFNIEIIDSSHLAVEQLKMDGGIHHPVRVASLSTENPASVSRPLESLIIGFGEVGRDAFRFLYEFGTFIKFNDGQAVETKPHITVIDSQMERLKGHFEANTPAIDYTTGDIRLLQLDCNSTDFYEDILTPQRCCELNYIVIALNDVDTNISLAVKIFNRIRKFRKDISNLIIMVRCNSNDKLAMMKIITDYYNIGNGRDNSNVIRLFGNPKDIYTCDIIIHDELTKNAQKFMENYEWLRGNNISWTSRREKYSGIYKVVGNDLNTIDVYPDIVKLRSLRRKESQDYANALHLDTKVFLLRHSLGIDYNWEKFIDNLLDENGIPRMVGSMSNIYYPKLSEFENTVMRNLAILEHARWNSSHELLGYVMNEEPFCNEETLKHNCLRKWDELDEQTRKTSTDTESYDYKSYDYSVVNTSIVIAIRQL